MRRTTILFVWLTLAAFRPCPAGAEPPYLFDLLDRPSYLQTWNSLLAGGKDIPQWLAAYAATTNGPSRPSWTVRDGQASYLVAWVCKTHDCGDNQFYVLFAENGKRAWGMLLEADRPERFFGRPSDVQQRLLRDAMHHP